MSLAAPRRRAAPTVRAWRVMQLAHHCVGAELERALTTAHRLRLIEFDALARLAEAERERLRNRELASVIGRSQPAVTRLCDRLVARGLVTRLSSKIDRRDTFVVLTDAGRDALDAADATFSAAFGAAFAEPLDALQVEALIDACASLAEET